MKYAYLTVFFFLLAITMLGIDESTGNFIFAGGSDGLMEIRVTNVWLKILLFFISAFFLFQFYKNKKMYSLILHTLFLFIWFLSGRTIANFPDGRISTGWFYFETNRILLCNEIVDCEAVIHYKTTIKSNSLWFLNIEANNKKYLFYVGPFIWSDTKEVFVDAYSH